MTKTYIQASKPKILINLSPEAISCLGQLAVASHRSRSNVVQLLLELAGKDGKVRAFLGGAQ